MGDGGSLCGSSLLERLLRWSVRARRRQVLRQRRADLRFERRLGDRNVLWERHVRVGKMRRCLYRRSNDVLRQRRADLRPLWNVGYPSRMHQSGLREWRLHG